MKRRLRIHPSIWGGAVALLACGFVILAPVARPLAADVDPGPSPIPVSQIPIPTGGVAVVYGPQYCCNLVTVSPDGTVSYENGAVKQAIPGSHAVWTWQRTRGTNPTVVRLSPTDAASFIATTKNIPAGGILPSIAVQAQPTFDRGTFWGVIRGDTIVRGRYSGAADPFFAYLGDPSPPTELVAPTPAPARIPSDAVGFVYEDAFFIVRRSGAVTTQFGSQFDGEVSEAGWTPRWGASLTYDVKPISPLLAWKIVSLAPLVYVPSGCPGLDDAKTYRYLVIVTQRGVSNGLFCHSWAPLRDDLMSVVREVFTDT